jgi:hypothetical protein
VYVNQVVKEMIMDVVLRWVVIGVGVLVAMGVIGMMSKKDNNTSPPKTGT